MLYVTTLDRTVTYTAQATLERATGPEGGLFVPMTLPQYDRKGLAAVLALPFWDCVASILNQFFPLRLQGSSLQGTEGVLPEPVYIRYKIAVAELWDRKTGSFQGLRSDLCDRLGSKLRSRGNWPFVAVDIALLFGLYGAACRSGWLRRGEPVQLAMASGEFTMPVAAWYARRMGLPLGDVICVCNENSAPWELLHRGELRLSSDCASTRLPLLDIGLPCNLERLVSQTLGTHTAELYGAVRSRRGTFSLNPEQQASLRAGFSVSVVSADRPGALIPRIFSTSDYLLSPYGALVYGGLMDYRALTGEGAPALLLAEESPLRWGEEVLTALGKPAENIVGMALYAIGDLHLSLGVAKPMDVFGGVWEGYTEKLKLGFSTVGPEDTTVLMGDLTWGMDLNQARADFAWIARIPGRKIIMKGNHDYWWTTASKFYRFCEENGFQNMYVLHNNCYFYNEYALCGTRGWFFEEERSGQHDEKVFHRELCRLEASLQAAGDRPKLCFLHYPPRYRGYECPEILKLLRRYGVRACYYGHLHGASHKLAIEGLWDGVDFRLLAADYLNFRPAKIISEEMQENGGQSAAHLLE